MNVDAEYDGGHPIVVFILHNICDQQKALTVITVHLLVAVGALIEVFNKFYAPSAHAEGA